MSDYKPLKSEPCVVRCVAGGEKIDYLDDSGSSAASLIETKFLFNSTIYDAKRGSKFMSYDLKDFFLYSPMKQPDYMLINMKHYPPDILN